jgi:hypothetical protein
MRPYVELEDVEFSYGQVRVLEGINLGAGRLGYSVIRQRHSDSGGGLATCRRR